MATITLKYDARNPIAQHFVDAFLQTGIKAGIWKTEETIKLSKKLNKSISEKNEGKTLRVSSKTFWDR